MAFNPVKNIVFDLGGVFLDVDYQKTRQAFINFGIINFDDFYQQSFSNPLFTDLEKGLITTDVFYSNFREATASKLTNNQIKYAWNAMLGSFRKSSISILPQLKEQYNIYLLSNTNAIHYEAFTDIYKKGFDNTSFDSHFHKAYYSHLFNERKPEKIAYETILTENNLQAAETLFVDDTMKNIEGAQFAGLQVLYIEKDGLLEDALKMIGL